MSDVASLTVLVNGIYENAKSPADLTGAQRKELENALYPIIDGYRVRKGAGTNYSAWEVGDQIIDITSAKLYVVGEVIAVPFDPGAGHIDDITKFDRYAKDSPAPV
ncbi:hypothetical protein [Robiginitalea biformata]|uniref:Uncharacterized protein n=1 Tax=Robiginitalea biformata (strain ATCC BAA-864 / DSM 15991 / KCTC 12146 / HTCC2501) TaxID=313596 RepID=A4CP52_ROBBH|nr:hypothetical protein [Robiginitalea biformata]EAR14669.1 hypothetical protein RB2501_01296 [Robiginitalea biformata HTCC2501]